MSKAHAFSGLLTETPRGRRKRELAFELKRAQGLIDSMLAVVSADNVMDAELDRIEGMLESFAGNFGKVSGLRVAWRVPDAAHVNLWWAWVNDSAYPGSAAVMPVLALGGNRGQLPTPEQAKTLLECKLHKEDREILENYLDHYSHQAAGPVTVDRWSDKRPDWL